MQPDKLDEFIEKIIEERNLPGINDEVKAQLVHDMKSRLLDQIDRAVVDALPDEKTDILIELLDKAAPDAEVQQFIKDSGVDVTQITIETMLRFRSLYLGESAKPGTE